MKERQLHKSSLFLMEVILAILLFSFSSTVCMRFFAKSYTLNRQTEELNHAVHEVSSKAEYLLHSEVPASFATPEYFTDSFAPCSSQEASYQLSVEPTYDSAFCSFLITFQNMNTSEIIYSLTVDSYQPARDQKGAH